MCKKSKPEQETAIEDTSLPPPPANNNTIANGKPHAEQNGKSHEEAHYVGGPLTNTIIGNGMSMKLRSGSDDEDDEGKRGDVY